MRLLNLCAAFAGLLTLWVAASPAVAQVSIGKNTFKYSGRSYFRGKSENVNLASYGEKKAPVGQANYLAVEDDIDRNTVKHVSVKISGPYDISWSSFKEGDVNAGISYLKTAGGTGSFSWSAAKTANLKLVKFSIDEGPLKTLLNSHASGARNHLKSEGADGRIVSEVWVVMEGTLASRVKNCGSFDGAASSNGLKVKINTSACAGASATVSIPTNTTFAYMMHKVKSWNGDKSRIEDLEDDNSGLN